MERNVCTVLKPFGNGALQERGLVALYQGAHIQEDRFELMLEAKIYFLLQCPTGQKFNIFFICIWETFIAVSLGAGVSFNKGHM